VSPASAEAIAAPAAVPTDSAANTSAVSAWRTSTVTTSSAERRTHQPEPAQWMRRDGIVIDGHPRERTTPASRTPERLAV